VFNNPVNEQTKTAASDYMWEELYAYIDVSKDISGDIKAFMNGFVSLLEHSSDKSNNVMSDDEIIRPNEVPYLPSFYDFSGMHDAENEAANEAYDQVNQDMFQTDFETFPDRGPAIGFRPLPAALEEALGNPLDPNNRQFGSNEITGRNIGEGLETEKPKNKKPGRNLSFRNRQPMNKKNPTLDNFTTANPEIIG